MNKFECHLLVENSNSRIINLLSEQCSLSINDIKKAIEKGALWHERGKSIQRCRRLKKKLQAADKVHFYYDEKVLAQAPSPAILMSDFIDYSIWYKPYGMLSQGSKWSDHCTISRWAQKNLATDRPTFIVHRLDRAASGLIILAHSKKSARALSEMFEHHKLEKTYHIIVHGDHRQRPQPELVTLAIEGKAARSHFSCLEYNQESDLSLLEVNIESGRKHQIRIHAASIGFPVLGDRLHGQHDSIQSPFKNIDLQLQAVKLCFSCPLTGNARQIALPESLKLSFPDC